MPSLPSSLPDDWLAPVPDLARVAWLRGRDFAHRGLHGEGAPENSGSAFDRAMLGGYGIELDVQRTFDGQPVVFHDFALERLTDHAGPIAGRTASELGAITLRGSADTICTLREALVRIDGLVPVLIEVKLRRESNAPGFCLAVRRALEGYAGAHAVMSFDPRVSRWFRRHSPETVRGLVLSRKEDSGALGRGRHRLAMWYAQPDFLAMDLRELPGRFATGQRRRGMPVATWTVRDLAGYERALTCTDARIFEGMIPPAADTRAA
ncbi:glycerophosphodiester phosphodiesterase [Novosphingobium sp. YJ-S2-02]|uniref:Glycerophosphodiester phosphodiesterase n=1 Tax=Novosphingobium aureum TaxID=2792964 RepID=A0A931HG23_9SPHN|nr:glycerophosphodiester phosphodiesterase family protein [Novosphingobium aureum]MBH0114753.1 glycerophosphodiester phosphodiesterase [Novosphingobium aureum]